MYIIISHGYITTKNSIFKNYIGRHKIIVRMRLYAGFFVVFLYLASSLEVQLSERLGCHPPVLSKPSHIFVSASSQDLDF